MSNDAIRPALTPAQWAHLSNDVAYLSEGDPGVAFYAGTPESYASLEERHGVAALCLHGQPFGFTREDVEDEQWAANVHDNLAAEADEPDSIADFQRRAANHRARAARIAALLPPETP